MNREARGKRRFIDRLGFRLGLVLSMALLPVGLLAVLQAQSLMSEARARSEAALVGETLRALLPELRMIRQGQGAAEALASVLPVLLPAPGQDATACDAALKRATSASDAYSAAVFAALDGTVLCTSDRASPPPVDAAAIAALPRPPQPVKIPTSDVGNGLTNGLAVAHPVFAGDGTGPLGYALVHMAHGSLARAAAAGEAEAGSLVLILFDDSGRIISANQEDGDATAFLPRDQSLVSLTEAASRTFTAPDTTGTTRSFAVINLPDVDFFALGSWPAAESALSIFGNTPAVAFPILMWAACLVAAWLAAEYMVTAHIQRLRRAITKFSDGTRRVVKLDMANAPLEIREVADAFEQMTDTILHDEAELEDSLHQKEVLLREVHHRVKNNLQLIASIMSMQMRKTKSTEAKSLMKGLQDRVISLATIHKGLYQTTGQADIRVNELFPEIVQQVIKLAAGPERRFDLQSSFDDIHLTPDQAVPLALLLTEAMTNAMKYAAPDPVTGSADLAVSCLRLPTDTAELVVANGSGVAGGAPDDIAETGGLGTQLIEAFARQLNGTLDRTVLDGSYRLVLRFPLRALSDGEERLRRDESEAAAE